jgi:hypothetical protein
MAEAVNINNDTELEGDRRRMDDKRGTRRRLREEKKANRRREERGE